MRRQLFAFTLALLLAFGLLPQLMDWRASATNITISSQTVPNIRWGGTTATLRIYSSQNFIASDGTPVLSGTVGTTNIYQSVSCTISGSTLTVPSFTLQSTLDGANRTDARYTAVFYDSHGSQKSILLGNFYVPSTPTTTTWSELAVTNASQPKPFGDTYSTTAQVQALIAARLPAPKASDAISGTVTLSVPPASSSTPIALGSNDRRIMNAFNVMNAPYYAVGDHSTDDTAAIQATITAAAGQPVHLPCGKRFKITSQLTNNGLPITLFSLCGQGESTQEAHNASLEWYGAAGGTMLSITGANYVRISGIAFEAFAGSNGADTAIKIDSPTRQADVIINDCSIRLSGVRSSFKAIYLSPTATSNNENMKISNVYCEASNSSSMAASRGSCLYMGNNSQADVIVLDRVWFAFGGTLIRTYGQDIKIVDSFLSAANVGISAASGDLTLDNVHTEGVRQFIRTETGLNQLVLQNSTIVNDAWVAATPVFDFSTGSLALDFRNNRFGNGANFDLAQVFIKPPTGANNVSLSSFNNIYPNITSLGFENIGLGYLSCHDRGLNGEIASLSWSGCVHGGPVRIPVAFTMGDADPIPAVTNYSAVRTANTGATTYTNFREGRNGQILIIIVGDANSTIQNNSNIVTRSGSNITCTNGATYTFYFDGSKWRQIN